MSDVQVKFKRGNTSTLNSTEITDGMIYFNTQNKRIYMDNGASRLEYANSMSNYMNKAHINSLVDKNSDIIVKPQDMQNLIGNAYIGGDTIISALNTLSSGKALFKKVWEDTTHEPFDTKTITIDGIYPFYFILTGEWYATKWEWNGGYTLNDYTITETAWRNNADFTSIGDYYPNLGYSYNAFQSKAQNFYHIVLNDNICYTLPFASDTNEIVKNARMIQILSNSSTNKTTFEFGQYGTYFDGVFKHESYETVLNQPDQANFHEIPFKIIGISSTHT